MKKTHDAAVTTAKDKGQAELVAFVRQLAERVHQVANMLESPDVSPEAKAAVTELVAAAARVTGHG